MPHAREQIRDAVVTAVTGLATTGSRVEPSAVFPLGQDFQPTLLVYTGDEQIEADSQGRPVNLLRSLEVIVEGHAGAPDANDMEELLDDITLEVETALGVGEGEQPLSGTVKEMQLTGIEPQREGDADRALGVVRLTYTVLYRTADAAPGTIIS